MTATTQPGITLELDAQIAFVERAVKSSGKHPTGGSLCRRYTAILASLIRLREIEGKLREPTPEMIDVGFDAAGKQYSPDPTDDGLELTLAVWKAMSALLLRGKP